MFWEIVTQDDDNLSGKSVVAFIENLQKVLPVKVVQVCEFEGAADRDLWTNLLNEGLIGIPRFLKEMEQVAQVDWGTFVLMKETSLPLENEQSPEQCLERVAVGDVIVRCVDDSFFYVYTMNNEICTFLQKNYQCVLTQYANWADVVWPE